MTVQGGPTSKSKTVPIETVGKKPKDAEKMVVDNNAGSGFKWQ